MMDCEVSPRPSVYVPYTFSMGEGTEILVRSQVPPLTLLHAVREQLRAMNPDQQTSSSANDLETRLTYEPEWQQEHLAAWIFWHFCLARPGPRRGRAAQRGVLHRGTTDQ